MGEHLIDGEFQSDKYPTCPRGKVPLSCADATAQPLLWQYAQIRRAVDPEFSADLEQALLNAGFKPPGAEPPNLARVTRITEIDPAELAVRMCEASYQIERPPGATGREAIEAMDPECRDGWLRAADAALRFIQERLAAAQRTN